MLCMTACPMPPELFAKTCPQLEPLRLTLISLNRAITVHWALPYLEEMLSPEAFKAFEETQVDPAMMQKDTGTFLFLNLETLDPKFRIPPNKRRRVNRNKMRKALLEDVKEHVHWSKRLVNLDTKDVWITAEFQDGYRAAGSIVVGAEGSNSRTRQFLCPDTYRNYEVCMQTWRAPDSV